MMCLYSRTADLARGAAPSNVADFFSGIVSAMLSHNDGTDEEDVGENAAKKPPLNVSKWKILKQHVLKTRSN